MANAARSRKRHRAVSTVSPGTNDAPQLTIEDLASLFETAPFGVIAIGPDGTIEYVNPRQCENSQLTREFFLGKNYRNTFGISLERAGLLAVFDELAERGVAFERTLLDYKRHADGANMAFSLRGYRSGRWILLVTGIEHVLANQQARYLQLFENANDGIFILSRDGRFVNANRKFAEMVGVPIDSLIGQTTEIFLPGRFAQSLERLERILREGRLGPYELEISTPLGRRFISLNGFALVEDGKPVGVINIARDTTEDHRRADELRQARDEALEASRLKSSFLANVSHEIRTPLNIILGYSSLVGARLEESGDTTQHEMLDGIRRAGRRLQDTISSILDISKIESGAFEVRPERIELATLVDRQVHDFVPLATAKGLALWSEIEAADATVSFDSYCLGNALMNLLANAVKFTERGEIRVKLARAFDGSLVLSVRDTGVGVDPAFLPRLGEVFAQEDIGLARRFEGSGLGLALTKRYLELNGARLSVESEKGKGSVFEIRFAREPEPAMPSSVAAGDTARSRLFPVDLHDSRVLVVEDDEATQAYMRMLLAGRCNLSLAANAEETRRALCTQAADIVLMDLSLRGDEDGVALTRSLRSDPRWRDLPIIALTAHAFDEDRSRALAAGCNDYLAKPFDPRELAVKMGALLHHEAGARPDTPRR